jgi:hypothetical protein
MLPAKRYILTICKFVLTVGMHKDLSDASLLAAETFTSVDSDTNKDRGAHLATALKVDVEAASRNRKLDEAETTTEDDLSAPLSAKADFLSSESLGQNSSAGRGFKILKDSRQVDDAPHSSKSSGLSSFGVRRGPLAMSVSSEDADPKVKIGSRIPWAQFFLNRTSRTLLFTWWVMAWISKFIRL